WLSGTSNLTAVNQDWDIPWHANMVRLIADSRQWSPHLSGHFAYYDTSLVTAPARSYPIAFHAVLALVWPASGVSIPAFINAFTLVLVAAQLPLSTMALTAVVLRRPLAVAAAGAISAWITVYPYDLLWRGPLIPFFAGMLMVGPFMLLATTLAVRRHWPGLVAVGLSGIAVIAVHPSLAFVAGPLLLAWLVGVVARSPREARGVLAYLAGAGALTVVLGLLIIREMAQEAGRVSSVWWPPDASLAAAIRDLIVLRHVSQGTWVVPVLGLVALVGLVLRGRRALWYVAPVALYAFLTLYTRASTAREAPAFTAPFYDDQWRLYAIYAMLVVPLLGVGVHYLATFLGQHPRRPAGRPAGAAPGRRTTAVGLGVLLVAAAVSAPLVTTNEQRLGWSTKVSGVTLSTDEISVMSNMSRWVPASATVLNDACDGSVWMYAIGDRMPMIRHFEILATRRQALLLNHFNQLATVPAVRAAAAQLGVEWVYSSAGRIRANDKPRTGLLHLDHLPFLTLVDRVGHASLYRVAWDKLPGGQAQVDRYASTRLREPGVPGTWQSTLPSPIATAWNAC
ncbi:DUF6541 family protein, partial [Pedococcus sp.]|uniref:DUF6541 family protein n=1 Tax=Pedococcus sp. TaxID=2860345 RepID=UPI002E1054C7|nr:DUF6541 family protein [Pedococcus sp.]